MKFCTKIFSNLDPRCDRGLVKWRMQKSESAKIWRLCYLWMQSFDQLCITTWCVTERQFCQHKRTFDCHVNWMRNVTCRIGDNCGCLLVLQVGFYFKRGYIIIFVSSSLLKDLLWNLPFKWKQVVKDSEAERRSSLLENKT